MVTISGDAQPSAEGHLFTKKLSWLTGIRACLVIILLIVLQASSPIAAEPKVKIWLPKEFHHGASTTRKVFDSIYENYRAEIEICNRTGREYFRAPATSTLFRVNGGPLVTLSDLPDGEGRYFHSPTQVGTYWVLGGANNAITISGYDTNPSLGEFLKPYDDSLGFAYPLKTASKLASRRGYWIVDPCVLDEEITRLSIVLVDEPDNLTRLEGPWSWGRYLQDGAPLLTANWNLPENYLDLDKVLNNADPFMRKPLGVGAIPESLVSFKAVCKGTRGKVGGGAALSKLPASILKMLSPG